MTWFEGFLTDGGADPVEGLGVLVVSGDEGIDGVPELSRRSEAGAFEGGAAEHGKPDLDLVEPTGVGRGEVEMDIGDAP